jgi:hypothetical protein
LKKKIFHRFDKKVNFKFVIFAIFIMSLSYGEEKSGLILFGIDTLNSGKGFDFVFQRPCTSSTDPGCNPHFKFFWDNAYFTQIIGQGLVLDKGKMNLDSIKSAPPDSQMKDDLGLGQPYMIFRIAPDSLEKCVGNVYILKTGTDPRSGVPMRAKFKILGFDMINATTHEIKMRFLWAVNPSGMAGLTTSGLDTFKLETPTISQSNKLLAKSTMSLSIKQRVFKIVGDRFVLPRELIGKVKSLTVWDLRGRKLGKIDVGNGKVELKRILGQIPMVLVKAEY